MIKNIFAKSFALKFTLVLLAVIIFIVATLSVLFFLNFNIISYALGRTNVEKSVENLKDNIEATMSTYAGLLKDAGTGTGSFFNRSADTHENLGFFYENLISNYPEIELLYFSSNELWDSPGGYWISGPQWIPPDNWDQRVRPWFVNAKNSAGAIAFSEPFLDANTGGIIISLSKTVKDRQGDDIGVIAMDMLVTKLDAEINKTLVYPGQHLYLLNKDGLYITNPENRKIMNSNFFSETNLESYMGEVLFSGNFHKQIGDIDFYAAQIPLTQWYLVSLTPRAEIFEETNKIIFRILLVCVLVFIASIFISIFYTRSMLTNPLKEMQEVALSMASMNFTNNFTKSGKNEIGDMQRALIQIQENIKKTLSLIGENANMVSASIIELSSSSMEISTTANEQSASVAEIVATMENNKELAAQAAEQTKEVAALALKTQELSRRGADLRDVNENMMFDILNQNRKIIEIINNLADMLSRVDESIQLIDTIADKTKLIAFNAALEASSAGEESGSRFSVVAGEIRRFADNVVESVAEIKEKITELQEASKMLILEANNGTNAINSGYNRMVEQKEVFENIVDVSQNVAESSQQISSLSKQQELASTQVFTALKEISAGVNQFVSATAITKTTIDKLNSMSIEMEETISKYKIIKGEA